MCENEKIPKKQQQKEHLTLTWYCTNNCNKSLITRFHATAKFSQQPEFQCYQSYEACQQLFTPCKVANRLVNKFDLNKPTYQGYAYKLVRARSRRSISGAVYWSMLSHYEALQYRSSPFPVENWRPQAGGWTRKRSIKSREEIKRQFLERPLQRNPVLLGRSPTLSPLPNTGA